MFSKTCEYAIRATVYIASGFKERERIGLKDVAEHIDSPHAFTGKILQKLVKKGIVDSRKGVGGGFSIDSKKWDSIKLIDIVEAIEGENFLGGCALGLNQCSELHPCPFHHVYKPIKESILKEIQNCTLSRLVSRYQTGIAFLKE